MEQHDRQSQSIWHVEKEKERETMVIALVVTLTANFRANEHILILKAPKRNTKFEIVSKGVGSFQLLTPGLILLIHVINA